MKNLLKFITCGSVDDGKSTLIGHILYDAKLLFADQEKALLLDSKVGSRGGEIDYSLLLDGLMAEREQGITIDVAYRYFSTQNRSFIVADTPGHEEYTRNMAVGASFAELAVILIDASQGVLIQTKRHTRICNMMGIKHFVFAVNKMDLANYSKETFENIKSEVLKLMSVYNFDSLNIIPVSATQGDNITSSSSNMLWYDGEPLLTYLENIDTTEKYDEEGFALPIQRVCRPNSEFRGFQGQISSGEIKVGDIITVYPSREKSRVNKIYQNDKDVKSSSKGYSVTISLEDEIDISRGCVICKDYDLLLSSTFEINILWMDEEKLSVGKNYLLCIGTQMVPAIVSSIKYKIDVNTGDKEQVDSISKNEIAVCEITTDKEVIFDLFSKNKDMGSLIMIDRITHMTSACGVILHSIKSNNLFWQNTEITRELRQNHLGQKAMSIWMTGLSGAGKSTIANVLEKKLFVAGKATMLLDGDNVRMGLNNNLGFSKEDRIENIRRVSEVAKLLNDAGIIVITSFISPYRKDRKNARNIIGDVFKEVYVSTPIEECIRRDVKGLYKKAQKGEIKNFTGIDSPYEEPYSAEVTVDTTKMSPEECADLIIKQLDLI